MAKGGGADGGKVLVGLAVAVLLAMLISGRGKQNSPLLPDALENQLDRLIGVLNRRFGHGWVDAGLDALQAYLQRAFPGIAGLLHTVLWVERNYPHLPGGSKRQKALDALRA